MSTFEYHPKPADSKFPGLHRLQQPIVVQFQKPVKVVLCGDRPHAMKFCIGDISEEDRAQLNSSVGQITATFPDEWMTLKSFIPEPDYYMFVKAPVDSYVYGGKRATTLEELPYESTCHISILILGMWLGDDGVLNPMLQVNQCDQLHVIMAERP